MHICASYSHICILFIYWHCIYFNRRLNSKKNRKQPKTIVALSWNIPLEATKLGRCTFGCFIYVIFQPRRRRWLLQNWNNHGSLTRLNINDKILMNTKRDAMTSLLNETNFSLTHCLNDQPYQLAPISIIGFQKGCNGRKNQINL